ncbi:RNA polymerase sigma factor [Bacteroides sp. 214]|uniref:RNA polymerase sigma factor n=1 Tax=Bacteroides sp. 214 TaxID=2302935 RepID=UPI0013D7536D|nr:RNA polymerase sigma factor [Bacteroides sp. 214]NDW13590.1 RNA polymerase sigma factor [Bacteroides sp. 214]
MKVNLSFRKELISIQNELHRFALKLTSNTEEADDLLQETILKALDNEDKYTPETNLKGWVYTIMKNLFINNYRRIVRKQLYAKQTEIIYSNSLQVSGKDDTETYCDLKEIYQAVNTLPLEYRLPFSMYISGFKYCEISEKLGLPLGTVKSRIFSTRQKLQKKLVDFIA